ncbi:MAG: hypothetical protein JSV08_08010, partial [Acidobacteriota bacterium]
MTSRRKKKRTRPPGGSTQCGRRKRRKDGCGGNGDPGELNSLSRIVNHYIRRWQKPAEEELRHFSSQPTLEKAIELAALARGPNGEKLFHQWRIPVSVLKKSHQCLSAAIQEIRSARPFEELHELILKKIGSIDGIGELAVYDTALRIGAKLRLEPSEVFLHAGVRDGARNLGLDVSKETIRMCELPPP